jgi:hypothetical protein
MNLLNILSKLDFSSEYQGISFKNQLLKKFGILFKFQYIIVWFTIIGLSLQNFLINNNETELLILLAESGYYVSKNNMPIMVKIIYIAFNLTYLLFITYYRFDSFEWLLNMNRIYNKIKTNSIDGKFLK